MSLGDRSAIAFFLLLALIIVSSEFWQAFRAAANAYAFYGLLLCVICILPVMDRRCSMFIAFKTSAVISRIKVSYNSIFHAHVTGIAPVRMCRAYVDVGQKTLIIASFIVMFG